MMWKYEDTLTFSTIVPQDVRPRVLGETDETADKKIRSRTCQSSSVSRRVLGVKWPMSFIGAIKGSLIRNETLKESLMIIHH